MAEIASAYPTAGGLYFWSRRLGGRKWAWITAWLNMIGQVEIAHVVTDDLVARPIRHECAEYRGGETWLSRQAFIRSKSLQEGYANPRCRPCRLAEREGFEPSVEVYPLRRFSKPLVSATHPSLQAERLRSRTMHKRPRAFPRGAHCTRSLASSRARIVLDHE